jgi:hypothetical protein
MAGHRIARLLKASREGEGPSPIPDRDAKKERLRRASSFSLFTLEQDRDYFSGEIVADKLEKRASCHDLQHLSYASITWPEPAVPCV